MNKIIFFINCHVNKQYDSLLNLYLNDFKNSSIEHRKDVKLIMVIVGKPEDYLKIRKYTEITLPGMFNDYEEKNILTSSTTERIEFRVFDNSRYEHVGIETVWSEAMASNDNDLITYTHCRGLGHQSPNHLEMNGSREVFSFYAASHIIRNYKDVEKIHKDNPQVTKVGLGQSPGGWMWFNFWTCKASYLKTRTKPDVDGTLTPMMKKHFDRWVQDRHYYEAWLGDDGKSNDQGYSLLLRNHIGATISGPMIIAAIRKLSGRMF